MGAYHALLGWLVAKYLPERGALRWLVGIPGAWLLIEWLRSWFLTGFGWLSLGYAHTDNWLGRPRARRRPVRPRPAHAAAGGRVWSTLLLGDRRDAHRRRRAVSSSIWGAAFALRGVEWTAAVQPPDHRGGGAGRDPAGREVDRRTISNPSSSCTRRCTREAHGAELIVWPESAIPDLANNHIEYYRDVYAGGERARLVADHGHAARRRESRRPARRSTSTPCSRWTSPRPASAGTTSITWCRSPEFVPGAGVRAQLAAAHGSAVFGFQSRRGAAGAARSGGPAHRRRASATRTPTARRSCRHCAPRRCS